MKSEIYYLGKKITFKDLENLYGKTYARHTKEIIENCTETCSIESKDGSLYIFIY